MFIRERCSSAQALERPMAIKIFIQPRKRDRTLWGEQRARSGRHEKVQRGTKEDKRLSIKLLAEGIMWKFS